MLLHVLALNEQISMILWVLKQQQRLSGRAARCLFSRFDIAGCDFSVFNTEGHFSHRLTQVIALLCRET